MATTQLQGPVTKTGTFNGAGVDISAQSTPWTIWAYVSSLTPSGAHAILALQTSNDAFATDNRTEQVWHATGPISNIAPLGFPPKHDYDLGGLRVGVTGVTARLALIELDGGASITYGANIIQG